MNATLLDGKKLAKQLRDVMKEEVVSLKTENLTPGLAVVLVGDNPASHTYVNAKAKACAEVGMYSKVIELPENTTQQTLANEIRGLNENPNIHGILVQFPLPPHLDEKEIIDMIHPSKDVDGFHPINVGNMMIGEDTLLPCTPAGIMEMLRMSGVSLTGKHAVVVGRSMLVGKPVSMLLLQENATVTVCHSKTAHLAAITNQADILIVAVGKPKMIGREHVRPGAIVIDVGINRMDNGKLCGDVDFDAVKEVAGAITPVPGGVGPMTIAMLLQNTLKSSKQSQNIYLD